MSIRKSKIKGVLTPRGDKSLVDPLSGYLNDSRYLNPSAGVYLAPGNEPKKS